MKCDKLEKWYAGQCSPSCIVYGANEVDEATAELKDKLALKTEFAIQCQMAAHTLQRKLRHQKYKRCLAMARWCNRMFSSTFGKERYWQKWNRRWLELAEKFKSNKEQ